MKNFFIMSLSLFINSCTMNPSSQNKFPLIYLGIDTTYDGKPIEEYCIHTAQLTLISMDSVFLETQSTPVAPIDSPYNIHGSSMTYYGKILNTNTNLVKIKWSMNLKNNIMCPPNSTNLLSTKKKNITIIDLLQDTLCLDNIQCIKQK